MGEDLGFLVPVSEVAEQVQGVPLAGDGLIVMAEVMVGVAQAVPGGGLALPVAEFAQQDEGVLAVEERPRVVAEQGMVPADRVQGPGQSVLVAGGPEQLERLQVVGERLVVTALNLQDDAEGAVCLRQLGPVTSGFR